MGQRPDARRLPKADARAVRSRDGAWLDQCSRDRLAHSGRDRGVAARSGERSERELPDRGGAGDGGRCRTPAGACVSAVRRAATESHPRLARHTRHVFKARPDADLAPVGSAAPYRQSHYLPPGAGRVEAQAVWDPAGGNRLRVLGLRATPTADVKSRTRSASNSRLKLTAAWSVAFARHVGFGTGRRSLASFG